MKELWRFKRFITKVTISDGPIRRRLPSVSPDWLVTGQANTALVRRPDVHRGSRESATLRAALWTSAFMFIHLRKGGGHEQIWNFLKSWKPRRVRRRRGNWLVVWCMESLLRSLLLPMASSLTAFGLAFVFFQPHNPFTLNLLSQNLPRVPPCSDSEPTCHLTVTCSHVTRPACLYSNRY